jgi:hypothetical protein
MRPKSAQMVEPVMKVWLQDALAAVAIFAFLIVGLLHAR